MRLSEEQMAREIKRAKRFNTVAFIVVVIITVAVLIGFHILDKKLPTLMGRQFFHRSFK